MSEVRRCRACAAAALIAVQEWDRSTNTFGLETSRTRGGGGVDWVCQACGAGHTVHDPGVLQLVWLPMGLMLAGIGLLLVGCAGLSSLWAAALGVGLGLLGAGLIWQVAGPFVWRAGHPVVVGAPTPEVRHPLLVSYRRCRCGAPARCVRATAESTNGIHTGTEYEHACDACGATFVAASPLQLAVLLLSGAVITPCAALFLPPEDTTDVVAALFAGGVGALTSALALRRGWTTLRHPRVAPP